MAGKPGDFPPDMEWLFPEYDFETIDIETHAGIIIERVLDRGSWDQLRWLFKTYSEEQIADWVAKHGFRLLSKGSFYLWRAALNIHEFTTLDWSSEARSLKVW